MPTTSTEPRSDLQQLLQSYLDAWNSDDPAERTLLLQRSVSDDVEFIDPMKQITGRIALAEHIGGVHAAYGSVSFASRGDVDAHNGVARVPWLARSDGGVELRGLDVYDIGSDGRLTRILGFFDEK